MNALYEMKDADAKDSYLMTWLARAGADSLAAFKKLEVSGASNALG